MRNTKQKSFFEKVKKWFFYRNVQNFAFKKRPKQTFWTKFSIFAKIFDFWPNLQFLKLVSIFDEIFDFFYQTYDFWRNFRFLTQFSIFGLKYFKFLGKFVEMVLAGAFCIKCSSISHASSRRSFISRRRISTFRR